LCAEGSSRFTVLHFNKPSQAFCIPVSSGK
jgi:hypothetical protein